MAPVKDAVLTGLDRVKALLVGGGYAELTAGVLKPYAGELDAFARAEVGWHPEESLSFFGFVEATLKQASAGLGLRKTF